jgi:ankyrin repeat protein
MKKIWVVAAFAVIAGTAGAQAPTEAVQAIRNNDLAALKAAISKGAVLNVGDSRGTTLLMEAAAYGSPEAIKLLLDSGANPNAKNQFGSTALTMAADQPETARMLVERGADVKAATRGGRTPIMIAAHCDGCSAMVKLLLDKGADPKAADARKRTALLEASEAGDLDSMKLLLAKGVDADPADVNGMTPLLGAAASCNLKA